MSGKKQPLHYGGDSCAESVCVFGGGFDTGNLGVEALTKSLLQQLSARLPRTCITVFDHTHRKNSGGAENVFVDGARIELRGARWSKRIYHADTLANIRCSAWFGGLFNASARRICGASAILDVSGGDSFTDLYGDWRYRQILAPKLIAIDQNVPLILLPQTYGPFRNWNSRRAAERIVQRASIAWARDEYSYQTLKDLAGDTGEPERQRRGVDLAFLLEDRNPQEAMETSIKQWSYEPRERRIGINVSGLLFTQSDRTERKFGMRANYQEVMLGILRRLLSETECSVLLVPHVLVPCGHRESDMAACDAIRTSLGVSAYGRLSIAAPARSAGEAKGVIGQCSWFCGARMHSTIAALSSGVPAAAIAYSPKTLGVFETCGQGEHVADPRSLETDQMIERLWSSFQQREQARDTLRRALPRVLERAEQQMDEIATVIRTRGRSVTEGAVAS